MTVSSILISLSSSMFVNHTILRNSDPPSKHTARTTRNTTQHLTCATIIQKAYNTQTSELQNFTQFVQKKNRKFFTLKLQAKKSSISSHLI